jgi:imidazolonepropionase-like amidohydrolase
MKRKIYLLAIIVFFLLPAFAQQDHYILLKADRVFDGELMHTGWVILIKNEKISAAGPMQFKLPEGTKIIELKNATLLPGLIEGHSHLFLHPYNETAWDDQVLKESRTERIARAINHAKATLMAGFTTVRDLGTEGAMYDDVGLKAAIAKGIVPGPGMIVATRAIVAKGAYGPKSANAEIELPIGAEEVSGMESIAQAVRTQIGKGADCIKVYADYRYGINNETAPTFTEQEMSLMVAIAGGSGRKVVAHASSAEGMRRAIMAGVSTIEHGDNGNPEIFKLMKEKGVALCPTLAAGDAILQYRGWQKNKIPMEPEPAQIIQKRKTFRMALDAGVTICMGGDVGVFAHGDNAREMEMLVDYGMQPLDVLKSATSINATVFGYGNKIGSIKEGLLADIIAVQGDPSVDIKNIRNIQLIIKGGKLIKE